MKEIYADGSSKALGTQRIGAWGVIAYEKYDGELKLEEIERYGDVEMGATNQKMELKALLEACKLANDYLKKGNKYATIYTDSMYAINCTTLWSRKWEKDNWTKKAGPIVNLPIIKEIYLNYMKEPVEGFHLCWVKGHGITYGNTETDKFCQSLSAEVKKELLKKEENNGRPKTI